MILAEKKKLIHRRDPKPTNPGGKEQWGHARGRLNGNSGHELESQGL